MLNLSANEKLVYAFRGWIAFVAFMDLGSAVRCFIEKRTFLDDAVVIAPCSASNQDPVLPRMVGVYSVVKALILIHCALFIHYKPMISMAICSLLATLLVHAMECFYFQTAPLGFYVIFPGLLNILTLAGLAVAARSLMQGDELLTTPDDENAELLRQAGMVKRKRFNRKKQQ